MTFRSGQKSQFEMIALVKRAGWTEDEKQKDVYRWREPKTKALYTLRDAFSLVSAMGRGMNGLRVK